MEEICNKAPIAISYRPKKQDYLPVIVAAIRRHLGDWPIALLTEEQYLPPAHWVERNAIQTITDWEHSAGANKILRFWEHQAVYSRYFEQWVWWHDDMLLLRAITDPAREFNQPLVAHRQRRRPNKELSNWHGWLWDTLNFFRCLNIPAPNPVLHIPRLISRKTLASIPPQWNRKRLLFEPTYLLWHWHIHRIETEVAKGYRKSVFKGDLPNISALESEGTSIMNWGRHINHASAREEFGALYPLSFNRDSGLQP